MNPIVLAIPVFFAAIAIEAWLLARRGRPVELADAVTSLQLGVLSQVSGLFTKALAVGIYARVFEAYRAHPWPMDRAWSWVLALVLYDLAYYVYHRLGHEVNVLWAAHVVHHSSERYNLTTALRQTSTGAVFGWIVYLPLAVLGVPPAMFVAVGLVDLLYQFGVHTELVGRLGWVDRVFVTPSNHRVHHGQNDYCLDKNYGGILIVWDRLFGTFAEEREGEPIAYGIRTPLASYDPVWGNLHVLASLAKAALSAPSWPQRIGVFLAPPGGWDDELVAHLDPETVPRFDTRARVETRRYVAVQYALLAPVVVDLLARAPSLARGELFADAAFVTIAASVLAALLMARRAARVLELVRLVVVGAAVAFAPTWFGFAWPPALRGAALVAVIASAVYAHAKLPRAESPA